MTSQNLSGSSLKIAQDVMPFHFLSLEESAHKFFLLNSTLIKIASGKAKLTRTD